MMTSLECENISECKGPIRPKHIEYGKYIDKFDDNDDYKFNRLCPSIFRNHINNDDDDADAGDDDTSYDTDNLSYDSCDSCHDDISPNTVDYVVSCCEKFCRQLQTTLGISPRNTVHVHNTPNANDTHHTD